MFDLCHYQTYNLSLKTADFDNLQRLVNMLCNYLIIENYPKIECSDLRLCDIIYLITPFTSVKIYIFAEAWF